MPNESELGGMQPLPTADLLPLEIARNSLFVVSAAGTGPFILILVVQSLLGTFGDKVQEVWGWALPTIMPTLAMIVTVLGYTALDPSTALCRPCAYRKPKSGRIVDGARRG